MTKKNKRSWTSGFVINKLATTAASRTTPLMMKYINHLEG